MTGSADDVTSSCGCIYGTFREGILSGEIKGIKAFEGNKGLNELWNMVTKTNRRDNSRQDGTQSVSRKNTSM